MKRRHSASVPARPHGLQASYLNPPIEIVPLRSKLQRAVGRPAAAQILLRLGYPESDVPAAPRRPIREVIEVIE